MSKWSGELGAAVYQRLSGNITGGVYDEVPPRAPTPYTEIGEGTEVPDDDHSDDGSEETVTLHTWDNSESSLPVKQIVGEIDNELHHATLILASGAVAYVTREFVEFVKEEEEPGKRWRHAVQRYRARIQEAP